MLRLIKIRSTYQKNMFNVSDETANDGETANDVCTCGALIVQLQ